MQDQSGVVDLKIQINFTKHVHLFAAQLTAICCRRGAKVNLMLEELTDKEFWVTQVTDLCFAEEISSFGKTFEHLKTLNTVLFS